MTPDLCTRHGLSESEHRRLGSRSRSVSINAGTCSDNVVDCEKLVSTRTPHEFAIRTSSSATSSEDVAKPWTIVGLGGSLASVSKSRAALEIALAGAASAGAETRLLGIRRLDLPMYNPDDDEPTAAAARLIESYYTADAMFWSSPMYQGTISGALKKCSTGCTLGIESRVRLQR
jgi:hypothetical protein